jgi:2'-5' RNA ligase
MRAFLAAPVNEATRVACAAWMQDLKLRMAKEAGRARLTWVRPDALHLTLKFLGEIDETVAECLRDVVSRAVQGGAVIALPLERLGAFPDEKFPRALWLGPGDDWRSADNARALTGLQRAIDEGCGSCGCARDPKAWSPHLTLARIRSGERDIARALRTTGALSARLDLPPLNIDRVVLMKSELLPDGPRHTPLWAQVLV